MMDAEFAHEVDGIRAMNDREALMLYVHTITERRQVSAVQHAILVGEAFIVANDRGWVPKGAEAKEWAKEHFGYSMSQLKRYRKMAKKPDTTLQAQQFIIQHRDSLEARDLKLAEPGSMQLADQAMKAYEAHQGATSSGLSDAEAWQRVESVLTPPQLPENTPKQQCQMLALLVATLLARHPNRVKELQSVLMEDDQQYELDSLSALLTMVAETRTADHYSELFRGNEERQFADCDWLPDPAAEPKKPAAQQKPAKKPAAKKKPAEKPAKRPAANPVADDNIFTVPSDAGPDAGPDPD